MRRYVTALTFFLSLAVSAAAYAQGAQVDEIMTSHPCNGVSPVANEVFIFTNPNFTGTCAALFQGFYPNPSPLNPGNFGLPNYSISSIKVGGAVRVRLFKDYVYSGSYVSIGAFSQLATMPSGWNDQVSSIRVENAARSPICDDLRPGEFSLFRDSNFTGDCVVLFYGHRYPLPVNMGIANDSVTSVRPGPAFAGCNNSVFEVILWKAANFQSIGPVFISGTPPASFISDGNDQTSAVSTGCLP